jgi:hypothetical protein
MKYNVRNYFRKYNFKQVYSDGKQQLTENEREIN